MRERKRRDDKDRHEFAWNPDYGWQILRRCPNYQEAVRQFLVAAKQAGDNVSLEAYKTLSLDEAKHLGNDLDSWLKRPSWVGIKRSKKSRKAILRDQDYSIQFPNVPPVRRGYGAGSEKEGFLSVDIQSKHYLKFYEWYGDLLAFPLNPATVQPRAASLSGLWSLYSIKVSENGERSNQLSTIQHDNLINICLTINTSFSKTMIEDDLKWFLRAKLDSTATIKEKPRWSPEEFQGYLRVMDAIYKDGIKGKITHREVGELCAPKRIRAKVNERAIVDWAKDTRKYVETRLMPIFDRPAPGSKPRY